MQFCWCVAAHLFTPVCACAPLWALCLNVCVFASAHRMAGVTTLLSVPLLSDEGKAPLADPHSLRDYQGSQAAPGLRLGGRGGGVGSKWGEESRGVGWTWTRHIHTHTHTSDQTAQSKCNTPHPLPGQQLARWWREIDQLGGFPPKMKIDGRISTAVGQPLASFSLLKTAHFHSGGKKEVQGLVVLVVTVIERVRNNKASKRLPFPGLSGSV